MILICYIFCLYFLDLLRRSLIFVVGLITFCYSSCIFVTIDRTTHIGLLSEIEQWSKASIFFFSRSGRPSASRSLRQKPEKMTREGRLSTVQVPGPATVGRGTACFEHHLKVGSHGWGRAEACLERGNFYSNSRIFSNPTETRTWILG